MRLLTAIPVYNEAASLVSVLTEVLKYAADVLVVDDGSTDRTPELLRDFPGVRTIRHPRNLGYGAGLRTAFETTLADGYDGLVTLDCDGQHEPARIPELAARLADADIVSGSRYLKVFDPDPAAARRAAADQRRSHALAQRVPGPEPDRRLLRLQGLSQRRPSSDSTSRTTAMPCRCRSGSRPLPAGMKIVEVPVPLIYLDESRAFGGALDDAEFRLQHYRRVFESALERAGLLAPAGCLG